MLPDETDPDPLTWSDFFITNIIIFLIWFIISFILSIIINEVNQRKPQIIQEVHYIKKSDDKVQSNPPKEELIKHKNSKCLYKCESTIDSYEYKKLVLYFPFFYWGYVIKGSFFNIIISALIAITTQSLLETLIYLFLLQVFLMIIYKVKLEYFAEKTFINSTKKEEEIKFYIEFYKDYFTRETKTTIQKIKYSDITRCIENDTNFYLEYKEKNQIIIIQKNECSLELINFIRETFPNFENYLGDRHKLKKLRPYHQTKFKKNALLILFIITIATLWGATDTTNLLNMINPPYGFSSAQNNWLYLCWLPIPILSIILGFKYKTVGYKCTKNIVAGFIISYILLVNGLEFFFPKFIEPYEKIYNYSSIIPAKLPKNGELEIQNWGSYLHEDKTEYTTINAYYIKYNTTTLENSIKNNSHWLQSKKIKSELKIFIPSQFNYDKDAYFSIYNKTLNQYNTLPTNSGTYQIFAMKYDISDKILEIHKFNYHYQ